MWGFAVAIRTIAAMGFRQVVGMPGFAGGCKSFVAEGYHPYSVGTRPLAAGKTDAGEGNRAGGLPPHTGSEAKDRDDLYLSCHHLTNGRHNVGSHPTSVGLGWVPPPFRYLPKKRTPQAELSTKMRKVTSKKADQAAGVSGVGVTGAAAPVKR